MISDTGLKSLAAAWKDVLQPICDELLQLREEKRKAVQSRAKSWEGAPEWATYRAQDGDGISHYFEVSPFFGDTEWWVARRCDRSCVAVRHDWRDTLETRP